MTELNPLKKYRHTPVRGFKHHFHLQDEVCCYIKGEKPRVKYLITRFRDEHDVEKPNWCSLTEKVSGKICGGVKFEQVEIIPC